MGTVKNKGGFKMVSAPQMDGGPVSPRKAMAGANVKGANMPVKYADGGCVTRVTGGSRVITGGMKNGGKVRR